mmetsp:Transcript_119777/g.298815  ORF Transcript_119777/g.298815 Transcript_119777/m.298815 type:complete len:154 (+) Transcript_119777:210-671(+)
MCRNEAAHLYARKAELEAAGLRVVVLVKEVLDNEVEDFKRVVWPEGDVFLDKEMRFYRLFFGGEYGQDSMMGFLCRLFCCCGGPSRRLKENLRGATANISEHNMKGEGFIKGGLLVVRQGGEIEYAFAEHELGEMAPMDEVVAASMRAAGQKT